ncbi:MAG: hypothetical protein ACLFPL_05310 [Candidatus Nanoarchaeia archaeon]
MFKLFIKIKILILEGVATSGKTSIIENLKTYFQTNQITYEIVEESDRIE